MLTGRLRARCPGARSIGVAVASGHAVEFAKRGTDDSAKATLVSRAESQAYGVVFEVPEPERRNLDWAEGAGYTAVTDFPVSLTSVGTSDNQVDVTTTTYVVASSWQTSILRPYHWYKALVVRGAVEHDLPVEHIDWLRAVPSIADPWSERPGFLAAQTALRTSIVDGNAAWR
jgi:gamma-glutamylcyclotransferase